MKDYKKILEGVVNIINTAEKSDIGFANICTYIGENCPELKENDDERMIQYFKDLAPFDKADELYEKYGFSHKDAIAWLEKQGEQKLLYVNDNAKEMLIKALERVEEQNNKGYKLDAFIEKAAKWLEDNAIEYWGTEAVDNGMMIDDFKKAMKL